MDKDTRKKKESERKKTEYRKLIANQCCPRCHKIIAKNSKHKICDTCRAYMKDYFDKNKAKHRELISKRYSEIMKNNQCPACRAVKPEGCKFVHCDACRAKYRKNSQDNKEQNRIRKKNLYNARKQAGLCTSCGTKLPIYYKKLLCPVCYNRIKMWKDSKHGD
ncbi:MAG: hypothetical protein LBH43_14620 [Treponema sp.]|jgi:hypothetical protein|nr:hypothetical protein [Treponema sp.]